MVRAFPFVPIQRPAKPDATARRPAARAPSWLLLLAALAISSGCAVVPRSQMDECQQLSRTLRSENARLRDQVLALRSQNRDYADRAMDDSRRLAVQDEAIERLEASVQAYQDERARLESAYKQLTASLGGAGLQPPGQSAHTRSPAPPRDGPRSPSSAGGSKGRQARSDDEVRR
jgi:uncharacterized protein HemX